MTNTVRFLTTALLAAIAVTGVAMGTTAAEFAFVTTTDFITGSSSRLLADGAHTTTKDVAMLHSDAVCRYFDGFLYVVNRFGGDNIQILDPSNGFATVRQISVGNGSDPHDVWVVGPNKAYVPRYNETGLWIVDPSTGAHTGTIDMSGLADADGIPEMDQLARVGDRVFVTIQRLDRNAFFTPVGTSFVAVIDATADTLVDVDGSAPGAQSILLSGTDPFSSIQLDPYTGRLYVSSVGFFGVQDFGAEWIDPVTFASEGVFFSESAAGGDINDVEIVAPDKGFAIISDASFNNVLIAFNPQTGANLGTVYAPGAFVLNDIELSPGGELFLADRTPTLPGIRCYDPTTNLELTANPIDVGLPPFDICFSVPVQTGIGEPPRVAAVLGQNYPNPFNPVTSIPYSVERAGHVRAGVYDARGRLVRVLVDEVLIAGQYQTTWNGVDTASRAVPSGVYFVRLEVSGRAYARKLVLLK
ncbi:MAG: T9SS type A sorting domain-containing protein [Candidatus Krumholzibacteriia bacterium]